MSAAGLLLVVAVGVRKLVVRHEPEQRTAPAAVGTGGSEHATSKVAYEPSDWNLAPVAVVYVGILILLVVSCFVIFVAYPKSLPDVGRTVRISPPGPHLQTDAEGDLRRFRAEEDKRLNSYYWINKSQAVVHIPIEQAMQKLAKTGIVGFPKGQQ